MAQFRGTLKGARGEASRLGTKKSGLSVTANGWDVGARVEMHHEDDTDYVVVFITGGSNARVGAQCLGMFKLAAAGTFEQVK